MFATSHVLFAALQNSEKKYILNGDFIVRTERWRVRLNSGMLEYSGSDEIVERINSTRMIGETVNVYVRIYMLKMFFFNINNILQEYY